MKTKKIFPLELTAAQVRNLKANACKMGRSAASLIRERIADLIAGPAADVSPKRTAPYKTVSVADMASVAMAQPFFDPAENGFRTGGKTN